MHDETPGGLACKDRTLAYWTDPNNFPLSAQGTASRENSGASQSARGHRVPLKAVAAGMWLAHIWKG